MYSNVAPNTSNISSVKKRITSGTDIKGNDSDTDIISKSINMTQIKSETLSLDMSNVNINGTNTNINHTSNISYIDSSRGFNKPFKFSRIFIRICSCFFSNNDVNKKGLPCKYLEMVLWIIIIICSILIILLTLHRHNTF